MNDLEQKAKNAIVEKARIFLGKNISGMPHERFWMESAHMLAEFADSVTVDLHQNIAALQAENAAYRELAGAASRIKRPVRYDEEYKCLVDADNKFIVHITNVNGGFAPHGPQIAKALNAALKDKAEGE